MRRLVTLGLILGCGGSSPKSTTPYGRAYELVPTVTAEAWYRSPNLCGQGPYELEVPVAGARWGEELELRVTTPRPVQLVAVVIADDEEVAKRDAVFDRTGQVGGRPANARCVAAISERLAASRGGGGAPGVPATAVVVTPPAVVLTPPREIAVTGQLEVDDTPVPGSVQIVRFGWREHGRRARVRFRLWSVEPNDLDGVRFGVRRVELRPNVPEAEYEAWLARLAAREEAERQRREAEWRARPPAPAPRQVVRSTATIEVDAKTELDRYRREEAARRRRAEAAVRDAERKRQRALFCAAHAEDRECWGAGGLAVHRDLERRRDERLAYCAARPADARCWSDAKRAEVEAAWQRRVREAAVVAQPPDGPPPAALAEEVPPKLSVNAEWRPGYWQWTGSTWTWLAGMWRVPEADIIAERTTIAPAPPPPLRVEAIPPPPMTTTVWVEGFWQWNGSAWIWVAGSYQARPAGMGWRRAEWRARGSVHVLIPGGWVRASGGRR